MTFPPLLRIVALACLAGLAGCQPPQKEAQSVEQELRRAWQGFRSGEFTDAIQRFESVRAKEDPNSRNYLIATYGLATTWSLRRPGEDPILAKALYEEVLNNKNAGDLAMWVTLDLGEQAATVTVNEEAGKKEAMRLFSKVITAAPDTPAGAEALVQREVVRVASGKPEAAAEAVKNLEGYLAENPGTPYITAIQFLNAQAYRMLNQPDKELAALISALDHWDRDPRSPRDDRSRFYWQVAILSEFRAGRPDIARQYYERLIKEFPRDNRIFYARKALDRLKNTPPPVPPAI